MAVAGVALLPSVANAGAAAGEATGWLPVAVASGVGDGLGLGLNARAAMITRGLAEMRRLGIAMGADPHTFAGLAAVGDLILTCTGNLSRNYTVGTKLGQGMKLAEKSFIVY